MKKEVESFEVMLLAMADRFSRVANLTASERKDLANELNTSKWGVDKTIEQSEDLVNACYVCSKFINTYH